MIDTLLITGGAGFIGANFARHVLARSDARLVIIDKLTYAGNLANIDDVLKNPRIRFVKVDIADRDAMISIFDENKPASVVNFAADSHVDRSIDDPSPFIETNVVGAFTLLEVSRRCLAKSTESARRAFRFLHISTDEVYGSLGETGAFSEATPYAPNSPYAASKASADHLVRAWRRTYGLPTLVTNCSNNYGPYHFP